MTVTDHRPEEGAERGNPPTLTHPQCINRLQSIRDAMSQLAELENPSAEDDRYFAELRDEFDQVDAHRRTLERQAELARIRSAADGLSGSRYLRTERGMQGAAGSSDTYDRDAFLEPDSVTEGRFRNPWDLSDVRTFDRSQDEVNAELRARALSAIEHMSSASDRIREAGTQIVERFDDKDAKISRMALLTSSPAYLRAFAKAATNRLNEITEAESRAISAVRALSLTDSAGGYLVPFQLDSTVIVTANGSRNDIRQIARNVVATGDVWNGVTAGQVAWSWDAEATQVSDDSPTFAQPSIPNYKAQGYVPISIEALQDMANGAQEIATLLAEGKDTLESAAFAIGSGVGQPTGIVTSLIGTGAVVPSATTDTLAAGDLYNVQGALAARYRRAASWLSTNQFYNRTRQFDQNGGGALWAQLGDDRPAQLLGKSIYECEDMDGTINASQENYMAVFGDFNSFVIADRLGMTVEFIQTVFGANQRPTGQRGWHAYYRTGSGAVNPSAFKLLNIT